MAPLAAGFVDRAQRASRNRITGVDAGLFDFTGRNLERRGKSGNLSTAVGAGNKQYTSTWNGPSIDPLGTTAADLLPLPLRAY